MQIALFAVPCLNQRNLCQYFFVCPKLPQTWGYLRQPYFYKNIEKDNQVVIRMSIDMSKLYRIDLFEITKKFPHCRKLPQHGVIWDKHVFLEYLPTGYSCETSQ